MNCSTLTIFTLKDEDTLPEEMAEFLYLLKGTYGAANAFCLKNPLLTLSEKNLAATAAQFRAFLEELSPVELDMLFNQDLDDKRLVTQRILRASPWEFVLYGLVPCLALAMIISGGELSFLGLKCKLNAIGDGVKKLKTGLGLGKKVVSGYGIKSAKIKLSKAEYAELKKQDPSKNSRGGFQSFLINLQNRVNKNTLEIELNQTDLARIEKYKSDPKAGGFQSRFLKIFGRHFPSNF